MSGTHVPLKRLSAGRKALVFLSACLIPCMATAQAETLDVVREGKAAATVVVAPGATDAIKAAAGILSESIAESSGAKLNVSDSAPGKGTVIYIGDGPWVKDFNVDQTDLERDGFEIRFSGNESMLIIGPSPWGTEFGVYDFLERYVGVRWLTPGEVGTHIPRHETIQVPVVSIRENPAFIDRSLSGLYAWEGNRGMSL